MKKYIIIPIFLLLNVLLESVVFTRLSIFGVQPDSIVAFATVIAISSGSYAGAAYAIGAGLILDIMFNKYIGLLPLIYMLSILGAGLFHRRYYADNNIFPCLIAGVLYIVKELLFVGFLLLIKMEFSFINVIWRYLLPSAILTAALAFPANAVYKRIRNRQVHVQRYR